MKTLFFTVFSLFLSFQLHSQSNEVFPLALGNRWVYEDEEGDIHTRNITAMQVIDGVEYYTRVDSSFLDMQVSAIDTVVLFYRPTNDNDIMSISQNQLVDTMKVRQVNYFSNPHSAVDPEWEEVYPTPEGPYDLIKVTAYRGFVGIDDVVQMGETGVFFHPLSYLGIFQDSISEDIDVELVFGSEFLLGNAQLAYGPGDIYIYEKQATLIAFQLQTTTGITSWRLPESLKLYPTPAQDMLFLDSREASTPVKIIGILDLLGRRMNISIPEASTFSTQEIDISRLLPGNYLMLLEVDGHPGTMRFVKG